MNKPQKIDRTLVSLIFCVIVVAFVHQTFAQTYPTPNPTEHKTLIQALLDALFGGSDENIPSEYTDEMPPRIREGFFNALSGTPMPEDIPFEEWMAEDEEGPNNSTGVIADEVLANYRPGEEDLATYGLNSSKFKQPSETLVNGFYEQLLKNPLRSWARDCLIYEKKLKPVLPAVQGYLSCAWVWFEGALDPSAVNCKDNPRPELRQSAAEPCAASRNRDGDKNAMLQVGGYQAFDQASNYHRYFEMCHDAANFNRVLARAYRNSSSSVNPYWSYPAQEKKGLVARYKDEIDTVSFEVIARSKADMDLLNGDLAKEERAQFFTLLLGKDPCMRVALNASAVSRLMDDMNRAQATGTGWARYVVNKSDELSARLLALRRFDREVVAREAQQILEDRTSSGGTTGGSATFNPNFGQLQMEQFCQCDQRWNRNGNDDICQSGCGLVSMAMIFTALGVPTVPTNEQGTGTYDTFKGVYWNRSTGMVTLLKALQSDYVRARGFRVEKMREAPVQAAEIAPYLTGANRGKCLVFGSQKKVDGNTFNHIFPIVDANPADNTIDVRDTWRSPVCRPRAGREISNIQNAPKYANFYYIAVCKTGS